MSAPGVRWAVALAAAALVCACGDAPEPKPAVPAWAKVAPEQIAEAEKYGVSVAFENDLGMRFVLIPAGTFVMGSPEDEEGRNDDETQHEVTISKPFYVQTTETTYGQYTRFQEHAMRLAFEGTPFEKEDMPAARVSWNDAVAYGERLSRELGDRSYRLPTEAEWEYACRAGAQERYWWGDSISNAHLYANALDAVTKAKEKRKYDGWPGDDGHRVVAPVGSYEPNGWGLYDMAGNVFEWCSDRYGPYPPGPAVDPTGPAEGDEVVARGGSWFEFPNLQRSAYREGWPRTVRALYFGFRLVTDLPEPGERGR